MNNKVIAIATLAVGATALGGMLIFRPGAEEVESSPDLLAANTSRAQDSYFDSSLSSAEAERPERSEINTQGRSSNTPQNTRGGWGAMLDRATEFDTDGDGILSEEERREMMRAMRDEWMERFDLDGDGELSREERMAARQSMFESSDRGQALMRQFDADGNGVLDDAEQAAMEAYQQEQRDQRRAEQLAQYDTDGDGELSRDERQAQRDEQRQSWGNRMQDATNEFDRDGDGVLSIEESQEAYAVYMERREIDRFISSYDADGNGSMGNADYSAFLSAYEVQDMHADVNGDGVVNSQDLSAYTNMVTRSRNRP
jgi:Ca2+-binding EF-hand superfamily protein